eukprot:CAMPEP_0113937720 /NCGR_PEP_ID=MMETSP1339-20121228/4277_1 /TAXON_ID=94617 /ORGANISM="Fibrocapsa japonica" /LENGTH=112 /DNA_ID=CAMNT_0000940591 /DNA_START=284 /DNA_END=622 /DNA_ORIENTATION=- /assembly_acc=CAM_ASM_000762
MAEEPEVEVKPLVSESIAEAEAEFAAKPTPVFQKPESKPIKINEQGGFSVNERARVGMSRDEDGKSNIWAVEPRGPEVAEQSGNQLAIGGGILIGFAAILAITVAVLPPPDI